MSRKQKQITSTYSSLLTSGKTRSIDNGKVKITPLFAFTDIMLTPYETVILSTNVTIALNKNEIACLDSICDDKFNLFIENKLYLYIDDPVLKVTIRNYTNSNIIIRMGKHIVNYIVRNLSLQDILGETNES